MAATVRYHGKSWGQCAFFWKELAPNRVEPRVTTSLCNDTWRRFFNVENNTRHVIFTNLRKEGIKRV